MNWNRMRMNVVVVVNLLIIFNVVTCSPKKYHHHHQDDGDSFQPVSGNNRYYESDLPKSVNLTDRIDKLEDSKRKTLETAEEKRLQRFGIPIATYATGTGSYNTGGNVGYTNPIKIDIGGVALGALLGLGIILVIPKLSNVFSSGHGYRSIEADMTSSLTELLSKVDKSLETFNIDGGSCVQRLVCSYVDEAAKKTKEGKGNTVDEMVQTIVNNSLFSYMVDGTVVQEAVEAGRSDKGGRGETKKCANFYAKCPVNRENVVQIAASLLSNVDKKVDEVQERA